MRKSFLVAGILALSVGVVPVADANNGRGPGNGKNPDKTEPASAYSDAACATADASWTNDDCAGRQWGVTNVRAPQAWTTTRGAGSTVAVIDTGADFNHPDLANNLVSASGSDMLKNTAYTCDWQQPGKNAKTSSAVAQDDNGHGTHVSGIVAAVTGNDFGVAAVAPDAKVLPVKVLDSDGSGSDTDVARGICFAVNNGADVINLSLGFNPAFSIIISGTGSQTAQAIDYAYTKGVSVIVAAGNETFPLCDFPASHEHALCVGSVDQNDVRAWYSNFGNVDIVAPGGAGSVFCHHSIDVWSTMLPSSPYDCSSDGMETLAGTSMAAPHVAAVAALVVSTGTSAPDAVYERLTSTATDLGSPGYDPVYGDGRVDAAAAVGA